MKKLYAQCEYDQEGVVSSLLVSSLKIVLLLDILRYNCIDLVFIGLVQEQMIIGIINQLYNPHNENGISLIQ